jgi:hypothetical protein
MKKIMIVAAITLCASFVNAASFSWKTTANFTSDGSTVGTAAALNGGSFALVYLGDTENWDWKNATVVDTATPNFVSSMGSTSAMTAKTFSFSMDDYGNGDVFGVVFKSSDNKLFYLQNGDANSMPTYTISGLSDNSSSLNDFNFANSAFTVSTSTDAALPVPEPTSGLLLVLGLAGLALRRKQK